MGAANLVNKELKDGIIVVQSEHLWRSNLNVFFMSHKISEDGKLELNLQRRLT